MRLDYTLINSKEINQSDNKGLFGGSLEIPERGINSIDTLNSYLKGDITIPKNIAIVQSTFLETFTGNSITIEHPNTFINDTGETLSYPIYVPICYPHQTDNTTEIYENSIGITIDPESGIGYTKESETYLLNSLSVDYEVTYEDKVDGQDEYNSSIHIYTIKNGNDTLSTIQVKCKHTEGDQDSYYLGTFKYSNLYKLIDYIQKQQNALKIDKVTFAFYTKGTDKVPYAGQMFFDLVKLPVNKDLSQEVCLNI